MNPYIKELIEGFHKKLNKIDPQPEDATHFKYYKDSFWGEFLFWYKVDSSQSVYMKGDSEWLWLTTAHKEFTNNDEFYKTYNICPIFKNL